MQALKAIIVGISDYAYGTDLIYCDEDASDWYDQLYDLGYNCKVYGDNHPENYPIYTGIASESNIRSAVQSLATSTGSGDIVCFIFSGRGGTNFWGNQYLYTQDCKQYMEAEIKADFDDYADGVNIFFFFDSDNSGGIISSLNDLPNKDHIYVAASCTEDGSRHEGVPIFPNSAWTFFFLEASWIGHFGGTRSTSMESVFAYTLIGYPYQGDDLPQKYDGNTGLSFYL
ncbi:MAG TPA: caspase family protein [Candidatus Bathyarchaeia archaeon]|nr:caspase family protein [Candidatus Bathyarchaeia archaeon]